MYDMCISPPPLLSPPSPQNQDSDVVGVLNMKFTQFKSTLYFQSSPWPSLNNLYIGTLIR